MSQRRAEGRGGTLGVFPIWENYAILQTQKYYLSHRKSHGRWWDRVLLKRKIFANLFRNPCGRMDFFEMFLLDFTPAPDYISWLIVVKGDEQRRNLCMAEFLDFVSNLICICISLFVFSIFSNQRFACKPAFVNLYFQRRPLPDCDFRRGQDWSKPSLGFDPDFNFAISST